MSYRQGGKYPDRDRGYDRGGPSRDYRAPPARGRQQLNYDDLDGDSTGLPPPRYPRGAFEDDRNSYRASGYDRRGGGGPYDRRRSRSPPPPPRRDDYRDRDSRSSRRSPSPRRRTRSPSRSRSPPSTSRRRHDSRSPPPTSRRDRNGERDRASPPPSSRREDGRERERSKSVVTADDAADVEEQDIASLMGFGGFGTTQGKAHDGELSGAAVKRERAHRQYMNRKGGFNRPLDKIK
ncbi:hypothetical protein JCM3766R1_004974 [Sporobolomyces carnicolor]